MSDIEEISGNVGIQKLIDGKRTFENYNSAMKPKQILYNLKEKKALNKLKYEKILSLVENRIYFFHLFFI